MNPMTTQHLGRQPGRARLGACGHRTLAPAHRAPTGVWSRSWHTTALTTAAAVATMSYADANPIADQGFCSTKRPARHLGTRST
jgi:hypothetical protein